MAPAVITGVADVEIAGWLPECDLPANSRGDAGLALPAEGTAVDGGVGAGPGPAVIGTATVDLLVIALLRSFTWGGSEWIAEPVPPQIVGFTPAPNLSFSRAVFD
jgi:hypothetical protein